jgi:hypothetical protein
VVKITASSYLFLVTGSKYFHGTGDMYRVCPIVLDDRRKSEISHLVNASDLEHVVASHYIRGITGVKDNLRIGDFFLSYSRPAVSKLASWDLLRFDDYTPLGCVLRKGDIIYAPTPNDHVPQVIIPSKKRLKRSFMDSFVLPPSHKTSAIRVYCPTFLTDTNYDKANQAAWNILSCTVTGVSGQDVQLRHSSSKKHLKTSMVIARPVDENLLYTGREFLVGGFQFNSYRGTLFEGKDSLDPSRVVTPERVREMFPTLTNENTFLFFYFHGKNFAGAEVYLMDPSSVKKIHTFTYTSEFAEYLKEVHPMMNRNYPGKPVIVFTNESFGWKSHAVLFRSKGFDAVDLYKPGPTNNWSVF